MGCWLRRCSSICPSTSYGTGQGSHRGSWALLPSPTAACGRQRADGCPSVPGTAARPQHPKPRRSCTRPGPPGCSRPRRCSSASCRGRRTPRSPSAGRAGLAPAAGPCCACPELWTEPRGRPDGTWPPRSPCWRWPGGAGSQRPPAPPAERAAVSGEPPTPHQRGAAALLPPTLAWPQRPGSRPGTAMGAAMGTAPTVTRPRPPPGRPLPTSPSAVPHPGRAAAGKDPAAPAPDPAGAWHSRQSPTTGWESQGPLTSRSLLWALREDRQGSTHSCQGSATSWSPSRNLLRILRHGGVHSGRGSQTAMPEAAPLPCPVGTASTRRDGEPRLPRHLRHPTSTQARAALSPRGPVPQESPVTTPTCPR